MSRSTSTQPKGILNHRLLVIGLILILGVAVTTAFVWMQTDHVIAPPGIRILDWIWRAFVR
jgi:hypothetical protein